MDKGKRELKKEYFSPKGRLNRSHYFIKIMFVSIMTFVFSVFTYMVLSQIFETIFDPYDPNQILGFILFFIMFLVPGTIFLGGGIAVLILSTQRLHDCDLSGYLATLIIIPYFGLFVILVLLFTPGIDEPNQHGDPPS